MENNSIKKSSLRYPKERHVSSSKLRIKLNSHGIEKKLKESFLTPLKLPFEGTSCKFSVRKVNTCDKCLQVDVIEPVNLENVVSKTSNEEKLNVDVQLIISLTNSCGSKTIIFSPLIEYNIYNTNLYFDNILHKSENYMDFESAWHDVNQKPHQVVNYELKIGNDSQSLLTYMKNINQNCSGNLNQGHGNGFPGKELYPVIRNSTSTDSKRKTHKSDNFETYKVISKDNPKEELKIIQKWIPQNVTGRLRIGIDRNLSFKYLPNSNKKLFIANCQCISVKDPCISSFAKTLLSCLDNGQPKKKSIESKTEYKMITNANEHKSNDEIGDLKIKIEEIKQQLPLNSPIDALLEVCGPKSHITDIILNKGYQKKVVHKKSDSRFRTIRKLSNTDSLSQTNLKLDDECLKLDFRNVDTPGSSKQSRGSSSRPNSPYFEIENFYVSHNSLDYLKNEVQMSLKSNVNVIETLYNLHDNVMNMENNLILFHQYLCSIKSEIGHLIFKHTSKQTNIGDLLKHIDSESKKRNLSSTKCNELYEKYCELESLTTNERNKTKIQNSSLIYFPFKFQVALSVIFLIGFICGDVVK